MIIFHMQLCSLKKEETEKRKQVVVMEEGKGGEVERKAVGRSLLVPSVKELVSEGGNQVIPPRYVQAEPLDQPLTLTSSDTRIPVVDMEGLIRGDTGELQSLDRACREWGFFQVVNHGVKDSLIERFRREVEGFFDLPMEEKRKYWQREDEIEGFGQAFVVSQEQMLDWADMFFLTTFPRNLRNPRLLPHLPPAFRAALEEYASNVQKLSMRLLDCLSISLGMAGNKGFLRELLGEDARQSIRMNYYPPCPEPDMVMGLTAHSDAVGLTILLQLNNVQGLQIKKEDRWVTVNPLPQAFIVNIGDVLEIMTNGEYRSVEHRAMVNPIRERISVAAFHNPGLEEDIAPSASFIGSDNPARFHRIKMIDYLRGNFSRKLDGKRYLDEMRIQ